jgi:hypothetical protein
VNKPEKLDVLKAAIPDLEALSRAMMCIAEMAPERMTLSQAIFFVQAAAADLRGEKPTFTEVRDSLGEEIRRTLHTTYRVILEKSRVYPKGLGWMKQELNPRDNREKFLKITPRGREVLSAVLHHLKVLGRTR